MGLEGGPPITCWHSKLGKLQRAPTCSLEMVGTIKNMHKKALIQTLELLNCPVKGESQSRGHASHRSPGMFRLLASLCLFGRMCAQALRRSIQTNVTAQSWPPYFTFEALKSPTRLECDGPRIRSCR